jgi:hypothetical protein
MKFSYVLTIFVFGFYTLLPMKEDSSYEHSSNSSEESFEYAEENKGEYTKIPKTSKKRNAPDKPQATFKISQDKKIKTENVDTLPEPTFSINFDGSEEHFTLFKVGPFYPPLTYCALNDTVPVNNQSLRPPSLSPWILEQQIPKNASVQKKSGKKNTASQISYHPLDFLPIEHKIFENNYSCHDEQNDRAHKKFLFSLLLSRALENKFPVTTNFREIRQSNREFLDEFKREHPSLSNVAVFFEKILKTHNFALSYQEIYNKIIETIDSVKHFYNLN